jgi:hypothetical protein
MRRLHVARNFIVTLLARLTHELALPHEFVPVHFAAFVDHRRLLLADFLALVVPERLRAEYFAFFP